MAKNDIVVRTAQDLERKYNFASILGLKKNVEITAQGILKIENELNSMLNALIINLADVLDSQSEISLWFYSGVPTTGNEPYASWTTPAEHIGDIYYDKDSGIVYQFNSYSNNDVWEVNPSPDLVEAMAITNSETDTTMDHERKVFFDTPVIPYSNGDWWVKSDGSLFICQISKTTGTFEENDYISANNYTESIAEKIEDTITVLKGTVTTLSDNYAKFTDLATGGSTTIAGENVTTGNIQSNNYVHNATGMKISLTNGTIDSKNFKTDQEGNVYLGTGAKVIGGDGLLTNLQYKTTGKYGSYAPLGFEYLYYQGLIVRTYDLSFDAYIPDNFTVTEAYVTLFHTPADWWVFETEESTVATEQWGYVRNIKLYKSPNNKNYKFLMDYASEYELQLPTNELVEITGAFTNDGYTATNTTGNTIESTRSIDIKTQLTTGNNKLILRSGITTPTTKKDSASYTGMCYGVLDIVGYMSYE